MVLTTKKKRSTVDVMLQPKAPKLVNIGAILPHRVVANFVVRGVASMSIKSK
jgi:hypothetical protein